ncbi:protealysin inhibitor emfourin [Microbacterium sp. Root553]|uniref:protealysin inhibitor emfourin n=1 Tax=Microbacterium sp. Root553 TaxID=1736556 RepID=UPI0006F4E9D8|nr:protealysin inhibitor emfourin [Microbacterium sp. Root553]KQZ23574.1 hypothetical protein ASD43_03745 [Microbacterium sp. Root553]
MSESPPPTDAQVVVAVVRTGGIAGIRRQWRVQPDPPDSHDWIAMIESCPWDADDDAASGADRFVWLIRARTPSDEYERERELSDSQLDGPWRALVDAVRAASD